MGGGGIGGGARYRLHFTSRLVDFGVIVVFFFLYYSLFI